MNKATWNLLGRDRQHCMTYNTDRQTSKLVEFPRFTYISYISLWQQHARYQVTLTWFLHQPTHIWATLWDVRLKKIRGVRLLKCNEASPGGIVLLDTCVSSLKFPQIGRVCRQ